MKKVLAILVSVFLLAAMIPMGAVSVSAAAIDMATFNSKLEEFKKTRYAEGSTYEDDPTSFGGYECFGFANEIAKYMFGSYPTKSMSATDTINKNWTVTYGKAAVDKLAVGDIVRYLYHSIFITKIEGDTIYYCQANVPYGTNKVTYENKTTRSDLKVNVGKQLTSGGTKTGWVAHYNKSVLGTTHLTIQYHANGGSIASEITGTTYKVAHSDGLNMRKDAGENKAKLTALPKNATFTVKTGDTKTADGYTWGKTTYGGYTGWVVISDFVKKIGSSRSGEYYLSSSMVYRSSDEKAETTVWKLGTGNVDGLRNAGTFKLTRDGYNFVGWCTKADGSATIFDETDGTVKAEDIYPNLKNGSATVTLYAIWEKASCDHVPVVVEEGYVPTCIEEGLTDGVECSLCGTLLAKQEIIPMLDHEAVLIDGYEATCTEDGLTDGEECGVCGEVLTEQTVIPALDHMIVVIEGYEPTCTEDGLTAGEECSVCGEVLTEQEVIDALDHDVIIIEGYEPTCTEDGLSEGEVCTVCGEVLVEQEIIYALDHDITYIEGYDPTCTEDGLTEGEECAVCGEVLMEQEVIPATGHEMAIIYGYESTCTEEGLTDGEECWVCGEVLKEQEIIPMLPHEGVTVDGYEPTCTEEGLTDGEECWYCGEILKEQKTIPMLPHEGVTVDGYEPTCTEEGLTNGEECWHCGEVLVEQETIPAVGHKIVTVEGYPATCTEDGLSDGKECAVCGEVLVEQEYIYALGHAYSSHYDATCNECGEVREVPNDPNVPEKPPVNPDLPADAPAFVVENTTAREGEEFTIAIRTERNSGIVSFKLKLAYDADVLELVSVKEKDFAGMSFSPFTNNPVTLNWVDAINPDNTTNGVVALVTFRVKEGASVGKTDITLSYNPDDVYKQNFDNVAFRVENGVVEIVEYTPGDVNNDGKVNNKDLGVLQQYLNEWDVVVSEKAADANGDGKVNNKDLGILQQYLNEWDVTLG